MTHNPGKIKEKMSSIWLHKHFKNSIWQKQIDKIPKDNWLKNVFNITKANFLIYKTPGD